MSTPEAKPRIPGYVNPQYIPLAQAAYLGVLRAARSFETPRIAHRSATELAEDLERAVEAAKEFCNSELERRLLEYQNVVIEDSMRGDYLVSTRRARDHFALGCRQALGTDR